MSLQSVTDRKLVGTYIRVGKSPKAGPIYRILRYDRSRLTLVVQSAFDPSAEAAPLSLADFDKGLEDKILHIIGRVKES